MSLQNVLTFAVVSAVFFSVYEVADAAGPSMTCPENFIKKGCYSDSVTTRTLPKLLIFARPEIEESWGNWDMFIQSLICRCAIQASKKGFKYFGIQFYGECWSGNVTSAEEYAALGPSDRCADRDLGPCKQESKLCVGKAFANFVYEIPKAPTTKPPASDCKDSLNECQQYADRGLCIDRYPDVLTYCPFSCGRCKL